MGILKSGTKTSKQFKSSDKCIIDNVEILQLEFRLLIIENEYKTGKGKIYKGRRNDRVTVN